MMALAYMALIAWLAISAGLHILFFHKLFWYFYRALSPFRSGGRSAQRGHYSQARNLHDRALSLTPVAITAGQGKKSGAQHADKKTDGPVGPIGQRNG